MGALWTWSSVAQVAIESRNQTATSVVVSGTYDDSYCVPTSSSGDYLSAISSSGAMTNISYTATSQPGEGYADETAQTFETYETQSFDILTTYMGGSNGVNVWVDWDQDMEFDETEELMAHEAGGDASKTLSITVPVGTPEGDYRMRIRGLYGDTANPSACGDQTWGSAVDFTLTVGTAPTCLVPTALTASGVTTTTADLGWTENDDANTWSIEYGEPGFTQGAGTMEEGVISNPYTLTGLTQSTEYAFYVQANCGSDDTSSWAGPYTFMTACDATSLPYVLDFDEVTTPNLPTCTMQENLGDGNIWETTQYNANGLSGNVLKYSNFLNSTNAANVWFYTQGLELEAGVNYQISYKFFGFTDNPESMKVAYGTAAESIAMTEELADYPSIGEAGDETDYFNVDADGVYYFGFHAYSDADGHTLYLDDIEVKEAPSCIAPGDLNASNITATSADLGWTANGTATTATWNLEYGEAGFDQGSGTLEEGLTSSPYALEDLEASTQYDVYMQTDCDTGGTSTWTGPYSFATICEPGEAPFSEGFEEGYSHGESLAGCWTQEEGEWTVNNTDTTYDRSPRTGDWNVTLRYGNEDWMFYPLNLDEGVTYELTFYAKQDANSGAYIEAGFGEDNNADAMTSVVPESGVVSGDYQEFTGSFIPDSSGVYYVGIKGRTNFTPWYISIDDISVIATSVPCDAVADVEVSDITETTATVNWTASASATDGYVVEVYENGLETVLFTETVATDVTTVDLTELTPDTDYDVYVISDCGDETTTSDVVTFTTEPTASVGDFDMIKLTVYPNPVSTNLNISAAKVIEEIQVYNILGQRIMTHKSNNSDVTLDVTELPSANYVLKVSVDGFMNTVKFVKK